jgi:diketogulonate reductase-like aldo/keto reductase
VERRTIPGSGETIPVIGCGTWQAFDAPPQLLLKWVLAHPAVTGVIPGTGRAAHMTEDCAAGEPPYPDAGQLRALMA